MINKKFTMAKNKKSYISQLDLIKEYFLSHPNREIPHPEVVDWATKEYSKRTKKVFRDPDRAVRSLHQKGFLIKVRKGVYKYDPDFIDNKDFDEFTPEQKEEILKRGDYRCAVCGLGEKDGVKLHIDHLKPKELAGEHTIENGQVLCEKHHFLLKEYKHKSLGKQFIINQYERAKYINDKEVMALSLELLEIFEKHGIDSHIEWKK